MARIVFVDGFGSDFQVVLVCYSPANRIFITLGPVPRGRARAPGPRPPGVEGAAPGWKGPDAYKPANWVVAN